MEQNACGKLEAEAAMPQGFRKAGIRLTAEERTALRELIIETGGGPKHYAAIAKTAGVSVSTVRREVTAMARDGIALPLARKTKTGGKNERVATAHRASKTSQNKLGEVPSSAKVSNTHGSIGLAIKHLIDWLRGIFRPAA